MSAVTPASTNSNSLTSNGVSTTNGDTTTSGSSGRSTSTINTTSVSTDAQQKLSQIEASAPLPWSEKHVGPNPVMVFIVGLVLVGYYVVFSSLGGAAYGPTSPVQTLFEVSLWIIFLTLLLLSGLAYFFKLDVMATIKHMFSASPRVEIEVQSKKDLGLPPAPMPSIVPTEQVYHVSNNMYTFQDAKAVCTALNGRLATIKDMDDAFDKGADWCSYGWSDGQMALFPTQYDHWEKLQKIPGHENDCGRPGINGGYIANPDVKFGINCFGLKPKMTPQQEQLMQNTPLYPKTVKELEFEQKVDQWKTKLGDLSIAPFNSKSWFRV